MAPENGPVEKRFLLEFASFLGSILVFGGVILKKTLKKKNKVSQSTTLLTFPKTFLKKNWKTAGSSSHPHLRKPVAQEVAGDQQTCSGQDLRGLGFAGCLHVTFWINEPRKKRIMENSTWSLKMMKKKMMFFFGGGGGEKKLPWDTKCCIKIRIPKFMEKQNRYWRVFVIRNSKHLGLLSQVQRVRKKNPITENGRGDVKNRWRKHEGKITPPRTDILHLKKAPKRKAGKNHRPFGPQKKSLDSKS